MLRLFVCAALAIGVFSCTYGSNDTGSQASDTSSVASGADDMGRDGTGTTGMTSGGDTTGLDVSAVQPVDSTDTTRPSAAERAPDTKRGIGTETQTGVGNKPTGQ
ncbi:hypothetical protein SAMN05444008_11951 [Cnuella takakiae]|uniref:Uncharacterized protein n=1 Tax=Cnuella takakiae TaxID=1302690 RepID=A0A1M5HGW9_9BACT|nr:hypothetical protein [Cnuella takakiae]OLY92866.1 hypothetical protein BUE76_13950 [Cnuella takakiae]SHG15177.1 hypothetical protein SAMN05444008_11951 [Cnuella takakiae]